MFINSTFKYIKLKYKRIQYNNKILTIMTYKLVFFGFYLMVVPLSILIFCDVQIVQNKLYIILHILLICIYLFNNILFSHKIKPKPKPTPTYRDGSRNNYSISSYYCV